MKIFLDCSDAELVRTYYETGLVDGVTTNPSLMLKAGKNPKDVYKEISDIFPFHASISAEVVGETAEDMLDMAEDLIDIGPNITIKVPCTPQGLKACKELSEDEVNVNVTLIFSAAHGAKTQVLAASIRESYQVAQAFKVGADICTIPSKVFEKMFTHVLTDKGLEIFDKDWKKLQSELGTT